MLIGKSLEAIERIDTDLFMVEIGGVEVIFTLPSKPKADQYSRLIQLADNDYGLQYSIYEHIFIHYVEDKFLAEHDKDIPAGISETVAKLILHLSGADENIVDYTNDLLEIYRNTSSTALNKMKSSICRIFQGYKFSDLDKLSYQDLVFLYVQAEQMLVEADIISDKDRLRLLHPEEAGQQKQIDIEKVIAQDALEYGKFSMDQEMGKQKIYDQQEYQARLQQLRQNKNGG
jgi:hypothetical protein